MWACGRTLLLVVILMFCIGCAGRMMISYGDVKKANYVELTLKSGQRIKGTILKAEPHQLTLYMGKKRSRIISKSDIQVIRRKYPVYDDFGRGISEEEIQLVQKEYNKMIYGIGGGALSFGASFFFGSILGQSVRNGKDVLIATTTCGGVLGTVLFIKAGKFKDRQIAIEMIRDKRKIAEVERKKIKPSQSELKDRLEAEKKQQEELREEREKLLRELKYKQSE